MTVEVLSRFRTPAQVRDVLERVKTGRVDLLIGTHKLLAKSVEFKDLGLLIIDEEQRFGVTHKEKLRQRTEQVDTLTLSATPLPRTLNMALSGIRDMSTIEQPPQERQPVQTYVLEHDWGIVTEAIRRELDRGGQVYYLHNRVESIDSTASRFWELLDGGVTNLHGEGGYLREPESVLLSVVSNRQLPRLEKLAHAIDPTCFMIVSHVTEVSGRGFSLDKNYQ